MRVTIKMFRNDVLHFVAALLFLFCTEEGQSQWTQSGSYMYFNLGNVGIGTTTPSGLMHLNSNASSGTQFHLQNTSLNGRAWNIYSTGQANSAGRGKLIFRDQTSLKDRLSIDSLGRIGIGTTTPRGLVDIAGDRLATGDSLLFYAAKGGDRGGSIIFRTGDGRVAAGDIEFKGGTCGEGPGGNITFRVGGGFGGALGSVKFLSGSVVIGSVQPNSAKLQVGGDVRVSGKVIATEVKVSTNVWSDHVFGENYNLKSIEELERFISSNKHLPGIPSAKQAIEHGVDVGALQVKLLEKVEELTLYMIQLKKENEALKQQIGLIASERQKPISNEFCRSNAR